MNKQIVDGILNSKMSESAKRLALFLHIAAEMKMSVCNLLEICAEHLEEIKENNVDWLVNDENVEKLMQAGCDLVVACNNYKAAKNEKYDEIE